MAMATVRSIALSALFLLGSLAQARAGTGPLFTSFSYALGAPYKIGYISVGDLNGDGMDDLVAGMSGGRGIAVAFATGGGSFSPFITSFPNRGFIRPMIGDFDGDGLADVGCGSILNSAPTQGPSSLLVGYGNGNGGWLDSSEVVVTGGDADLVGIADLNNDGRSDLVFAFADSDSIAIYLGNANRTMSLAGRYETHGAPSDVAIGDVQGSPAPDVVVSCSLVDSLSLSVFPGNGDGTLGARHDTPITMGGYIQLAPMDPQPGLDLVMTLLGEAVAPGLGGGAFGPPVSVPQSTLGADMVVRDFNLDGRPDLACTNYTSYPRVINVWLNDGAGGFGPRLDSSGSNAPLVLPEAGDVDHDGKVDILWPFVTVANVWVAMGNGNGTFGGPSPPPSINGTMVSVAAGDFDGDGKVDAVGATSVLSFAR
jgi:hypothetical protein